MKNLLLSLPLFASASAIAAPGDFDTSFNGQGYTVLAAPAVSANAICIDSSQRIVVGAGSQVATNLYRGALLRYLSNGAWDTAFGWREIGVIDESPQIPSLLCGSDYVATTIERIYVSTGAYSQRIRLDVVPQSGAISPSYLLGDNTVYAGSQRVALASPYPNRWIVGATIAMPGAANAALIRVDGPSPQWTGSTLGPSGNGEYTDAFIDGSGNLFAVGRYSNTTPATQGVDAFVTSLDSAGLPRAAFGANGTSVFATPADDYGQRIAPGGGGKLYLGMTAITADRPSIRILRLSANGSVDSSFAGPGGLVIDDAHLGDIVEDSVGRLIVAGSRDGKAMIRRVSAQGAPDATFGVNGERVFGFGSTGARFGALAIDAQGRIVVAGRRDDSQRGGTVVPAAVVVARFLP
jgi:uncharacterized delta-60 repeat protein